MYISQPNYKHIHNRLLSSPIRTPNMESIVQFTKQSVHRLVQNQQEMPLSLLIVHHWSKLLIQTIQRIWSQILYPTVHHQLYQISDQFRILTQIQIHLHTFKFKSLIVLTLSSSHCFNHLFSDFYRRSIRFWVFTQNKPKINMKELTLIIQQ